MRLVRTLARMCLADYHRPKFLEPAQSDVGCSFMGCLQKHNADHVLDAQVHAEGEAEHAALGHTAVTSFVPAEHHDLLRSAMLDHDRDFAVFYNHLADLLE